MCSFNLKNKSRISYNELEEPNLDEYVFCSHCGDFVYEFCSIHGPLLVIPDDKPPTISPFPPCVPRAALTIPHVFLHIAPSRIPGAGLGVFATLALPSGVRFGPYCGIKTDKVTSMYCWQINDYKNKRSYVIDAKDPNKSNWMRYVNCSRHWYEQNLIAYQYRGRLYYRTIKNIPRYTELMVFYGSQFAHMLQIDLKKYNAPTTYALKFGSPPQEKCSSLQKSHNAIPSSTNSIKEKATKNSHDNSKLESLQKNEILKDVSKTNFKKNVPQAHKKPKFRVPKNIQKDKNEIVQNISNNRKIITSRKNNQTAEITSKQTEETNISTKSCDLNNNENIKTEFLEQLSKESNKGSEKEESKDKDTIHVSVIENNDIITNKSSKNVDKTLVQKFFFCDICNYKTALEKIFTTHVLTHGVANKYSCNCCDYITKFKTSLKRHIRTHTGEKPYACNFCDKKFNQKGHLISHIRTHTGEKPCTCNFCDKKFNRKDDLIRHIRTHTGEKPYACNFCDKKFNQKSHLIRHIRTHTGEKPYACNFCDKKFNRKGTLIPHIRTHTGEKPYTCNFCDEKFNHKGTLISHIRTHTGEKPYACNFCDKKFNRKDHLIGHIRIHTGEKPYACNFCDKKFNQKGDLIRHIRTHTGEKPYACNFCDKKFNQKGDLIRHIRTHTGEKPYACNFCDEKFNHKSTLISHIRTHTGEKPYACNFCDKKFNIKGNLIRHIRTHTLKDA